MACNNFKTSIDLWRFHVESRKREVSKDHIIFVEQNNVYLNSVDRAFFFDTWIL